MNPRIVKGRRGTPIALAARGRVLGTTFQIGVDRSGTARHDRLRIEDRLLQEARSLVRQASRTGAFDWTAHRFRRNAEFDVWEKTLSAVELARLMRD